MIAEIRANKSQPGGHVWNKVTQSGTMGNHQCVSIFTKNGLDQYSGSLCCLQNNHLFRHRYRMLSSIKMMINSKSIIYLKSLLLLLPCSGMVWVFTN